MFLRYKPKGDRVNAEQVTAENAEALAKLFQGRVFKTEDHSKPQTDAENERRAGVSVEASVAGFEYPTFEGVKKYNVGEWVVQKEDGTYKKMTDQEFGEQYEPAKLTVTRSA